MDQRHNCKPGVAYRIAVLVSIGFASLDRPVLAQEGAIRGVHDPCVIRTDAGYVLFSTGPGIPIRRSKDLIRWERSGRVFAKNPDWFRDAVPGAGWIWAPDISFRDGKYWLYYSVSTFGSNRSCIGLATNETLDPASPDSRWIDHGEVVDSGKGDDWNAIDPNLFVDVDDRPWLAFGSFWGGIKLVALDPGSGKPMEENPRLFALAARPIGKAIEAPFLVRHGDSYYLFVSFDRCCRGVNSDYKVMVGRSRSVEGPYVDKDGRPMLEGGGSLVLAGAGRLRGPGHNAILRDGDREWFVHHFYDAELRGAQTLQIRPLRWTADGWPDVGEPLAWAPAPPR